MSGGFVSRGGAPTLLPLPSVYVRRPNWRQSHFWAGRARTAATADPDRPRRNDCGPERLSGADRARVLGARMIVRRGVKFLDDRLGSSAFIKAALHKVFPDHWSFMLGEICLYAFIVLLLTGSYLAFFFNDSSAPVVYHGPYASLDGRSVPASFASVMNISFSTHLGLLIRQMHHWGALVFAGAIIFHMMRIFFTGAFRKPREMNWTIGVTLLLLAMGEGFCGYSLPGDLLS